MSPFGKQILPMAQSELERQLAEAEQRGAARVLREVAKLPDFQTAYGLYRSASTTYSDDRGCVSQEWSRCHWCHVEVEGRPPHPDNGCLYVRALAAGRDEAR